MRRPLRSLSAFCPTMRYRCSATGNTHVVGINGAEHPIPLMGTARGASVKSSCDGPAPCSDEKVRMLEPQPSCSIITHAEALDDAAFALRQPSASAIHVCDQLLEHHRLQFHRTAAMCQTQPLTHPDSLFPMR